MRHIPNDARKCRQTHLKTNKLILAITLAVASLALFAGCKQQSQMISTSDLIGPWYSEESFSYRTVEYFEDGSYTSSHWGNGRYGVYKKTGTVTLASNNEIVMRLAPSNLYGSWTLICTGNDADIVLTREPREEPTIKETVQEEAASMQSKNIMAILSNDAWVDDSGSMVVFSSDFMTTAAFSAEYEITTTTYEAENTRLSVALSGVGDGSGSITITPVYNDDPQSYFEKHGFYPAPSTHIIHISIPSISFDFVGTPYSKNN